MTLDHEDIQAIADTVSPMVASMVAAIITNQQGKGVEQSKTRKAVKHDLQAALARKSQRGN